MPDQITGGDLSHLWRVSDVHLPRVADVYYDAGRLVGGARSGAAGADTAGFRANASAYPGATTALTSTIGNAWGVLRDELLTMYADVGHTVLDAAEGVRQAMKDFVDADMVSADALSTYLADPANAPTSPQSRPPVAGSDEDPGAPVLPD